MHFSKQNNKKKLLRLEAFPYLTINRKHKAFDTTHKSENINKFHKGERNINDLWTETLQNCKPNHSLQLNTMKLPRPVHFLPPYYFKIFSIVSPLTLEVGELSSSRDEYMTSFLIGDELALLTSEKPFMRLCNISDIYICWRKY